MNLTNKELADRFEKVGNDLKAFCEKHGLDNTEVDMGETDDCRSRYEHLCETPACHGGWIAILYGEEAAPGDDNFYVRGAHILAEKLGFDDYRLLEQWARDYPEYWGNSRGDCMFCSGRAFGQNSFYFPLSVIYNHYFKVAENLRNAAEEDQS